MSFNCCVSPRCNSWKFITFQSYGISQLSHNIICYSFTSYESRQKQSKIYLFYSYWSNLSRCYILPVLINQRSKFGIMNCYPCSSLNKIVWVNDFHSSFCHKLYKYNFKSKWSDELRGYLLSRSFLQIIFLVQV